MIEKLEEFVDGYASFAFSFKQWVQCLETPRERVNVYGDRFPSVAHQCFWEYLGKGWD